jgi:membrane protease YdiL (CAAX protease family)
LSTAPGLLPAGSIPAPAPVGLFQFSIEGRRAPALFVTGWVALLVGLGATLVGFLSAQGGGSVLLFGVGMAITSIALFLLGGSQTVERGAAGRAYAGPSPVLVFVATIVASLTAILVVGTVLELGGAQASRPVGDLLLEIVQTVVFVGVVQLLVVGAGAISWRDMGFVRSAPSVAVALVYGAVLAVPMIFITALVGAALIAIFGVQPSSPLPATGSTTGLVLNLITGAVFAPVAEEVVFRGVAVTAWARELPARSAIVRAAIMFAVAHILTTGGSSFGPAASLAFVSAAARLPIALALGWVYLRSGTIWTSIGMHAAFNAILLVAAEAALTVPAS